MSMGTESNIIKFPGTLVPASQNSIDGSGKNHGGLSVTKTVRNAQEQLYAQSWSRIEQKLGKTGKHLRIKNERDLIRISENFYQIINEQRKGQGGAVIKPITVLKELGHNHENSTKALYRHAIKPGNANTSRLICSLTFRCQFLDRLAELAGESGNALKASMFKGTSVYGTEAPPDAFPGVKHTLSDLMQSASRRISEKYRVLEMISDYWKFNFRGDPARPEQLLRDGDAMMSWGSDFDRVNLKIPHQGKVDIALTWAFPRATFGRRHLAQYPAILCILKNPPLLAHEYTYVNAYGAGQMLPTGMLGFDPQINEVEEAFNHPDVDCLQVQGHIIEEYSWVIIPDINGNSIGAIEVRKGHLACMPTPSPSFGSDYGRQGDAGYRLKPEWESKCSDLTEMPEARNFSTTRFLEIEDYRGDGLRQSAILPLSRKHIAQSSIPILKDWSLINQDFEKAEYYYLNERTIEWLSNLLGITDYQGDTPDGEAAISIYDETYLETLAFDVRDRPGWRLEPVNTYELTADNISNEDFGEYQLRRGDVPTKAGDVAEEFAINTLPFFIEYNLLDLFLKKARLRLVDALDLDAEAKSKNFSVRMKALADAINTRRQLFIDEYSPDNVLADSKESQTNE